MFNPSPSPVAVVAVVAVALAVSGLPVGQATIGDVAAVLVGAVALRTGGDKR